MDLEIIILSDVKDTYHVISFVCGILKNNTGELIYKIKITHRQESKVTVTKREEGG